MNEESIVIYLRTSTEEQNPQNQLKECLTLVGEKPYQIVEERQSAFKDKDRPLFEEIRTGIKKGRIKQLVVWDWDRLYRNRKKLKEFFELCKIYKCEIHSFRQKFFEEFYNIPEPFDEIMQELFLNLLGWMAEDESRKKGERVKIAHQNSKKKWGRKPISKKVTKEILELRDNGMSIREIAQSVFYWDKNNNRRSVSIGHVQKVLSEVKE